MSETRRAGRSSLSKEGEDSARRWSPPVIDEVTDAMLDEIFTPLESEHEWTPLDYVSGERT